jgi:prolipoprotein diacylglyceryltransferase
MGKFNKIFGIAVAAMFVLLGFWLLFSPRFNYLTKEIKVIFAVFLFLYGAFRMVRYFFKERDDEEE